MILSWSAIYQAGWLWLPLAILTGMLNLTSQARAQRTCFKILHYYFGAALLIWCYAPFTWQRVILDLGTRFLLVVLAGELFWNECGSGSGARSHAHSLLSLLDQGKDNKKTLPMPEIPAHEAGLPRTYLLRVLYGLYAMVTIVWLALGISFIGLHFVLQPR